MNPQPEQNAERRTKRAGRGVFSLRYVVVALVLAGMASGTTAYVMHTMSADVAERERDRREAVQADVAFVAGQVKDLRKKVELATGKPSPDAVFDGMPSGTLSEENLRQHFARLRRELVDLAQAVNHLDTDRDDSPAEKQLSYDLTEAPAAFEIAIEQPIQNRSVTIRNLGEDLVNNPRIIVNGRKQWSTTADIVDEVIDDGMSDREKALALWHFLVDNRHHSRPAHNAIEMHDPVRYLNVYGYGFCDDSAAVYQVLAEEAGLKARIWELEGHVVPEAFFDGDWHMLDPDGEIYYLEDDGQTIASVETLQQRPDIIRGNLNATYANNASRLEKFVGIYTSVKDNYVNEWYRRTSETVHQMDFSLRPGESIYRSWDNWGMYFADEFIREPKRYGNGRFVYRPMLRDGLYSKGNQVEGLTLTTDTETSALAANGDSDGVWVIPVESPYPVLGGKVEILGTIGESGSLRLEFSGDGDRWHEVARADEEGPVSIDASTRPYFRNGHGRPIYAYRLRLTLSGSARIEHLQVESDFQHAPHALPELETGNNRIEYSDDSSDRNVQIEFECPWIRLA